MSKFKIHQNKMSLMRGIGSFFRNVELIQGKDLKYHKGQYPVALYHLDKLIIA
jgi:hypothetical protein